MWDLLRPDTFGAWRDPRIQERFPHYWKLLHNQEVAYYKIAKSVEVPQLEPVCDIAELKKMHKSARQQFREKFAAGQTLQEFDEKPLPSGPTFLDLKVRLAQEYLRSCNFCENMCGVDRTQGKVGTCGVPENVCVASAFAHMGEETLLIPSGTVFFFGCTFKCVFCQNSDISQEWRTSKSPLSGSVTPEELARIVKRLYSQEVKNINYVGGDPTSDLHIILESMQYHDMNICLLWNSNFYNSLDALDLLLDVMDLWLPDWKYGNDDCAQKYSKITNYVEVMQRNFKIIHDDGSGEIIIRHLVMPGHVECCSKPALAWIAENLPKAVVNIMGQYHPEFRAKQYPEIARRPTPEEMGDVRRYATEIGIVWESV